MSGKYIIMVLCTLICFSSPGQNFEPMEANIYKKLYPYLGANDLYGYADFEGNIRIEPQYTKAGFFQNNIAIVRSEGEKEKLIDAENQQIPIPLKYNELRQYSFSHHTIIELTEVYTNRWRFWEWRFLPDLSFFGSPRRNRLFDIGVMREKRSLYWLEGRHKIQSKKGGMDNGETYLNSVSENAIQVDDKFYRIENRVIKRIGKNIKIGKKIAGGYYLQKKGSSFQIIDSTGRVAIPQKFIPQLTMELDIEGIPFTLTTESRYAIYHKSLVDLYSDGRKNTYVYPDFSKKFPKKIHSYPFQDSITALEILKYTQSLVSIRDSDRFLLVLEFGKKIFVLDTMGNWQDPKESMGKVTVVSRVGNILWPTYHDELGAPSLLDGWRITSFRSFDGREDWYEITIRKEEESLKGVWDRNMKTWVISPEYRQIGYRSFHGRFLSFQIEKEGKWGLYDFQDQKVHIPPTYDYINESGWVHLNESKTQKQFYLDIENKREFRKN